MFDKVYRAVSALLILTTFSNLILKGVKNDRLSKYRKPARIKRYNSIVKLLLKETPNG